MHHVHDWAAKGIPHDDLMAKSLSNFDLELICTFCDMIKVI